MQVKFLIKMSKLITLLVSILVFDRAVNAKQPKVLLSVFYESLCPHSQSFILNQLLPVMEEMHPNVKLKLVPFGKAKSKNFGYGGFECQHGPAECLGNMIQDCTLYLMADRSDLDKLKYVACEMETQAAAKNSLVCVQKSNVPVTWVQQCIQDGKGVLLQLDAEFLTQKVNGPPWPNFIPSVTINQVFNQEVQDHALVNLMSTVCSKLRETKSCETKPCDMRHPHC